MMDPLARRVAFRFVHRADEGEEKPSKYGGPGVARYETQDTYDRMSR